MFFVAACGDVCGSSCETEVMIGKDRNSTHSRALAATADAFVDGRTARQRQAPLRGVAANRAAGKAAGGFVLIDPDALGPDSTTLWTVQRDRSVALRHSWGFAMGARTEGYGAVTLAVGETRYDLPKGMGVLTDPTRIDMQSLSLQHEIGLRRAWALPAAQIQTAVGLGAQISVTDTSVQSALLNVHYRSVVSQPYAAVRLALRPDVGPLAAELEARVARDGVTQIRTDLRMGF